MPLSKKQEDLFNQVQEYMNSNKALATDEQRQSILSFLKHAICETNSFDDQIKDCAKEVTSSGYSVEKISEFIYNYYMSLEPKEMYSELEGHWPKGIELPSCPSDEVLKENKERLANTTKSLFETACNKSLSTKEVDFTDFNNKKKTENISSRNFQAFMLKPNAKDAKENKRIVDVFLSGDKEKFKEEVEKVYDYYLANENIFDKKYSDKELVDNWGMLSHFGIAIGMEYESFQKGLKDMDIQIDPSKQKRLDDMFVKGYAFINVNRPKIGYISSGLSVIGESKQFYDSKTVQALKGSNDTEIQRGANTAKREKAMASVAYGKYASRTVFKESKDIEIIFDKNGKTYKPEQSSLYGEVLMNGEDLYYIKKGEMQKHTLSPSEEGFPIQPKDEAKKPATPAERDELFNAKMQALTDSDEPKAMKDIKENVLYNQYKLALICANPKSPSFEADYKNTLATLAAAVTIQEMAETTDPTPEILESLASKDTLKNCTKDLKKSGFADKFAEKFKDNPSAATEMTSKELFKEVKETEKQVSKAAEKTNDAPKKETQAMSL